MNLTKRQAIILYHAMTYRSEPNMVARAMGINLTWLDCDGEPEHVAHDRQDEMNVVCFLRSIADALEGEETNETKETP